MIFAGSGRGGGAASGVSADSVTGSRTFRPSTDGHERGRVDRGRDRHSQPPATPRRTRRGSGPARGPPALSHPLFRLEHMFDEWESSQGVATADRLRRRFPTRDEEAAWVASAIASRIAMGTAPERIVLSIPRLRFSHPRDTRSHDAFTRELARVRVPYILDAGRWPMDRLELCLLRSVLDVLAVGPAQPDEFSSVVMKMARWAAPRLASTETLCLFGDWVEHASVRPSAATAAACVAEIAFGGRRDAGLDMDLSRVLSAGVTATETGVDRWPELRSLVCAMDDLARTGAPPLDALIAGAVRVEDAEAAPSLNPAVVFAADGADLPDLAVRCGLVSTTSDW